jgi:two-component system, NtrC family, response regulator AtoC
MNGSTPAMHGVHDNGALDRATASTLAFRPPHSVVFGTTPKMQMVRQKIEKIKGTDLPVLIQGESGTGKEIIAHMIHATSRSATGKFVKVNCPAIPASLVESELFGYERGAFTGANGNKPGRVELANGGSLFLDEIGELDGALQAKLLQLLQDGKFCPIGGQLDKRVEIRVICATNRDLEAEIAGGTFRQDLFYRINVVNLRLPSLRERRADIPEIVAYFLNLHNEKFNCNAQPLSARLMLGLQQYHWPGNIRQLENLMKRYVILGSEDVIESELLPREQGNEYVLPEISFAGPISLKKVMRQMVREMETRIIVKILQENQWNRKRAARALSISYRALLYKVKQAQVAPPGGSLNFEE